MTPEAMAALHALAFTDMPRPWSAAEFAALLAQPSTIVVLGDAGFALGRVAGPEADLMTVAVHPAARRRGIGRALLAAFEAAAARRGAEEVVLEVAVSNAAARALYKARGYAPVGRRPGYYHPACGPAVDAQVLRRALRDRGKTAGKTD